MEKKPTYHCFFEQSGTFKNEFKKLGYQALDYDILNDFGETDFVMDLYVEINNAFNGGGSIFDMITSNDMILAFFPCIRFEAQIIMAFQGKKHGLAKWSIEQRLEYGLRLHAELHELYCLITKLVLVCKRKNIPLIIENPYSTQHYLVRYWALPSDLIDMNRYEKGDYYKKPTQYWFVNCKPKHNFIFEATNIKPKQRIAHTNTKERSMISPDYANRFIREYILDNEELGEN